MKKIKNKKIKLSILTSKLKMKLFLFIFLPFQVLAIYTLADLEVLYQDKSYKEYLDHARDIRPTKRNKRWKSMLSEIAPKYIKFLTQTSQINEHNFNYIERLRDIMILENDNIFQLRRFQFALKFFNICSLDKKKCYLKFLRFTQKDFGILDYHYKLYQMAEDYFELRKNILMILTKSSLSEIYCKKNKIYEDIKTLIKEKITPQSPLKNYKDILFSFVNKNCLNSIKHSFYKELINSKDNMNNEFLIKLLISHDLLSSSESDYILTRFILDGPIVGDVFNLAWNRLDLLSLKYSRRENLLKKLLENNPLPGNIFSHPDKKKKNVIIKLFSNKFPEFLDSYIKRCISYYSGKQSFPFGNPTPNCSSLMETTKKTKIISDYVRKEYSSSKKLK